MSSVMAVLGAAPIHDFLAYTYVNWIAPPPSFALLVGDGHYDPKNYAGYGRISYLPPSPGRIPIRGSSRRPPTTATSTLAGRGHLPGYDAGAGWAVNSSTEASAIVKQNRGRTSKARRPANGPNRCWAVADDPSGFAQISDSLLDSLLCRSPTRQSGCYYGRQHHATPAQARTAIQDGINAGKLIATISVMAR